ncbi:glycosyltransferase [Sulfurimonas sp. HSL-1716]|uniref:glycosyltransferase n=1 Tax=Hydrocurvibacter sulfurireducens TaxID=3131937 RepID=UPI0031F771FD
MNSDIKISVIIPTYNRARVLEKCIESLCSSQGVSKASYEIIVVDNASTDDTKERVGRVQRIHDSIDIFYKYEPVAGLLSARHSGAKTARGEILTFIDDDVTVDPLWLKSIRDTFEEIKECGILGGRSLPVYEIEPPKWLDTLWTVKDNIRMCGQLSLIDMGEDTIEISPLYVWGLNFSIKKELFLKLGGFNPDNIPSKLQRFQGDGESGLSYKAIEQNVKAYYNPAVLVHHHIPAQRLTKEYMYSRMFYQGVCDSYSKLRKYRQFSDLEERKAKRVSTKESASSEDALKDVMHNGYLDGYIFHQEEVKNDPKLFAWVIKEDYMDYDYNLFMESI